MTIAAPDFINAFPEFNDSSAYPFTQINFWIAQAYNQLSSDRLGVTLDLAAMLFVAHNMVLSARAAATATAGGIPGQSTGPVNSKGVGALHVGYDTPAMEIPGAGAWNGTSYGQRLYRMMVAAAAGGLYVPKGTCLWPIGTSLTNTFIN
jgi:hypothetical protein